MSYTRSNRFFPLSLLFPRFPSPTDISLPPCTVFVPPDVQDITGSGLTRGFASESDMLAFIREDPLYVITAVVFTLSAPERTGASYVVYADITLPSSPNATAYLSSGFLTVQQAIDQVCSHWLRVVRRR